MLAEDDRDRRGGHPGPARAGSTPAGRPPRQTWRCVMRSIPFRLPGRSAGGLRLPAMVLRAAALAAAPALAQLTTGNIEGAIRDEAGEVVRGATVPGPNVDRRRKRTLTPNRQD